ncbi:MAG: hypothetical protein QNJ94_02380 [Alphaproteobacteria bacterium]|nr:hypothetical protein [Alphaproteobacteria bacterium]
MRSLYRAIMDADVNPLKNLGRAQRFQVMVYLSIMWTTIFCAAAGAWLWYGELIVGHLLIASGFLVTGVTFHRASRAGTYRDHPLQDGTARYDDVWGG